MAEALPFLAGAAALGALAGVAFALAWRFAFPPGGQGRFWASLSAVGHRMLVADTGAEFLSAYKALGLALGGYLGRNLLVMAAGGAALMAALLLGLAPMHARFDRSGGALQASGGAAFAQRLPDGSAVFVANGRAFPVAINERLAICSTRAGCAGLALLGFHTEEVSAENQAPILIRSFRGDRNPLWPYLSDLDAAFFAAFVLAMTIGVLWPGRRARPASMIRAGDFALLQINETFQPLVRRLGDAETRRVREQLPPIDRPVFITGLARSGTTTVLNALTRSPEVASHQYRDFPFLGAPLTWARLQGAVARDQAPVERPHKDRIRITKLSPEAYEEPLWTQFFPGAHAPSGVLRLSASASNPAFERFFAEHLRKIMLLRGADRYVSKGNYNIGRIEYLARLFPDARFVVPVREPLAHVASLVRQHRLFCEYAREDPRVPVYLAAAGHFEFGPQRQPISLDREAAGTSGAVFADGDAIGYARQWAAVYGHVLRVMGNLGGRILLVRYEDFCAEPEEALAKILTFCELADPTGSARAFAAEVSSSEAPAPPEVLAAADGIWRIVQAPAEALGYVREGAREAPRRPALQS